MGLLSRRSGDDTSRPLMWSVVVAAPKGDAGEQWGDTWFARDLVAALERKGQRAKVVFRGGANSEKRDDDDVVLVLRGLSRVQPRTPTRSDTTWMMWIISHPELIEREEPAQYDAVFAASASWGAGAALEFGVPVTPLLQATDPRRFNPEAAALDTGHDVLFVGSTRGEFRPVVRDALAAGVAMSVFGVGWQGVIPSEFIAGEFLPNVELPVAYASAGVVLNDHWPDMAEQGFLSNRLFDAVASGARVVSDDALGLHEVFGDAVVTYAHPADLARIMTSNREDVFPSHEARLAAARMVEHEHSFDARAEILIERATQIREAR